MNIYTIGFSKKTAEYFFETLKEKDITILIDIRLNNNSQLSGFSKYPDIGYFLKKICGIDYYHDKMFAPEKETLKSYQKKEIDWELYKEQFEKTMQERKIDEYIKEKYNFIKSKNVCFLCSEANPDFCHRSLVAKIFSIFFDDSKIIHL